MTLVTNCLQEELKFVLMDNGVQSVMMIGVTMKLMLSAHNLIIFRMVCSTESISLCCLSLIIVTIVGSVPAPGGAFGQSTYQIVANNFACNGFESTIHDCSYTASPDCGHHQDAGVYCNVKCDEGDVRLVNASSLSEGRLEVCSNSTWHPVCDEFWSTEDSTVVCRQLGLSTIGEHLIFTILVLLILRWHDDYLSIDFKTIFSCRCKSIRSLHIWYWTNLVNVLWVQLHWD